MAFRETARLLGPSLCNALERLYPRPEDVPNFILTRSWRFGLPFLPPQALYSGVYGVLFHPLVTFWQRCWLAPEARKLHSIFPHPVELWKAVTRTTTVKYLPDFENKILNRASKSINRVLDKIGRFGVLSLFQSSCAALEAVGRIIEDMSDFCLYQALLPIFKYFGPHLDRSKLYIFGGFAAAGLAFQLAAQVTETMRTRLMVQDFILESSEKMDDLIAFRSGKDDGPLGAFRTIIREEGYGALVKGWKQTAIVSTVSYGLTLAVLAVEFVSHIDLLLAAAEA